MQWLAVGIVGESKLAATLLLLMLAVISFLFSGIPVLLVLLRRHLVLKTIILSSFWNPIIFLEILLSFLCILFWEVILLEWHIIDLEFFEAMLLLICFPLLCVKISI